MLLLCRTIYPTVCSQLSTSPLLALHHHIYDFPPFFFNSIMNWQMCHVYLCCRWDFQSFFAFHWSKQWQYYSLISLSKLVQHGLPADTSPTFVPVVRRKHTSVINEVLIILQRIILQYCHLQFLLKYLAVKKYKLCEDCNVAITACLTLS